LPVAEDIIGNKFGPLSQLTILKRLPRGNRKSRVIRYSVFCSICAKDPELFADGIFETDISNLKAGKMPCGCASLPKWTEAQTKVRLRRKSSLSEGISFIDFVEDYKGNVTKIILICDQHGPWCTGNVANFLGRGKGCPSCRVDAFTSARKKSDDEMIKSFFDGNTFHPETLFTRADKPSHWTVHCPVCNTTNDCYSGSLQSGSKPCVCSRKEQKYGYVNTIKDGETLVAIKFGITGKSSKERSYEQNRRSVFQVDNILNWEFGSNTHARAAEKFCKDNLTTGILSKEEMPDGYTETTYTTNLEFIIQIFEKHGGAPL
jgi:hypothetical protein